MYFSRIEVVPWERERISRVVAVLVVFFVLAGYTVPWVHMERAYPWLTPWVNGSYEIDIFVWGFSACYPAGLPVGSEQFAVLWVDLLPSSQVAAGALSFLRWFTHRGEYLFAGSFVCYLLATMLSLFQLSRRGKKARTAIYAFGLPLASLLLFLIGVEDAVTSHAASLIGFSWEAGVYVCAISFILAAFSWHHSRELPATKEGMGSESSIVGATRNEGGSGSAQNDRSV